MRSEANTLRLFIGCGLPAADRTLIEAHLAQAQWPAHWRMLDASSWHVTALFIGAWPEERLAQLLSLVEQRAAAYPPIQLNEGTLCSMPGDTPTMRWVRFKPHTSLTALHHDLASALQLAPSPYAPYWPHITLARARNSSAQAVDQEGQLILPSMTLEGLSLYRSDPSPAGRLHRPIATWPFTGTAPADLGVVV